MEIKLKSVFQNHKLRLAVKALLFAVLLTALKSGGLGFWSVLLFLAGTIAVYATPLFRTLDLLATLVVLFADAILILSTFSANIYVWLCVPYLTALFYIIMGIKELAFVKRDSWQRILALGLAYPMLLMVFYYTQANTLMRLGGIFISLLIVTKDVLSSRLPSWLISLLSLEVVWAIALLPIGFVSQAGLAALSYFILLDVSCYYYVEKNLNKQLLLVHGTLLALLTLLLLAFSRWGL